MLDEDDNAELVLLELKELIVGSAAISIGAVQSHLAEAEEDKDEVRSTLSVLAKRGCVEISDDHVKLTPTGVQIADALIGRSSRGTPP